MSPYTQHIQTTHLGGIRYRLDAPLLWELGEVGSGDFITVPQGFVFDVSIPWWVRRAFDPHDLRYRKAAALHDHLLSKPNYSRAMAAAVFYDALKADGASAFRRAVMTMAVIFKTVR